MATVRCSRRHEIATGRCSRCQEMATGRCSRRQEMTTGRCSRRQEMATGRCSRQEMATGRCSRRHAMATGRCSRHKIRHVVTAHRPLVRSSTQHGDFDKLANTEAYKQSLQRLEEHSEATAALGTPPLRTHYVSLSDVKRNHLDASIAQLCIPVSGALSSGMLRTRSVRDAHTGWHLEEAALDMNNEHVITILPSTTGSHQS
uniref:cytochrome c oxidase assembly factor 1 homolog isoform X2 n=1 Tax=Myxine glutinosa TaxID=7769 RepID=UPI00358FA287